MKAILSIARYTIIEQIRNRLYLIILFFGAMILLTSILIGTLAPSHRVRVIFDIGLFSIEIFGLVTAVFGAVTLVLQEIESKTVYLILTRPIQRSTYIIGRFIGLITAVMMTMLIMALLHIGTMTYIPLEFRIFLDTVDFWAVYPTLVFMSIGKMIMTTAIALFFSLFATSSVSALIFTGGFWVAGHFGTELAFLIEKSFTGVMAKVAHLLAVVFPNFQYFNFRDSFGFPEFPGFQFIGWAWLYALGYVAFFISLSSVLFSRKEF
ncbi:hypothetical protein BVX98_05065 [bacterium F11]|nr:hypothetical protein BVX98_05065 [bacterium F11]